MKNLANRLGAYVCLSLATLGVSACVNAPSAMALAQSGVNITSETGKGLPPQELAPGECGLFLWSRTDTTRFVFFARAGANNALFLLEEEPKKLTKLVERGELFGQFYTIIEFQTEAGAPVWLSYEPGQALDGGARVSNGLIQYHNSEGWQVSLPVLGARVCQPAAAGRAGP